MAALPNGSERARFSSYVFVPTTGELSSSGIPLRLESQPARVLEILIEAEGNLVSREEIIAALWPGEVEGNFDRRLDKAVAKLRASLNDDPVNPRFVATLKGRGYRFLPPVAFDQSGSNASGAAPALEIPVDVPVAGQAIIPVQPLSASPSRVRILRRMFSLRIAAALAGIALAASAAAIWMHTRQRAAAHQRPVVLIAEFHDLSNSTEDSWVLHYIQEWLATDLTSGGELRIVRSEGKTELDYHFPQDGCSELPRSMIEIAQQAFRADIVIYGDYASTEDGASGERGQLTVCLQGVRGGKKPESVTVIGAKGDVAELVFNAGEQLRAKLGLKQLSSQSLGYLRATLPVNPAAARFYAEGTSALERFQPEEASVLLTEAAQIEPPHAPTHAALSDAWGELGYEKRSQDEAALARNLAKNLSPVQQVEYEGLAAEARNDWPAAVSAYGKLLQMYPDSVDYGLKLAKAQIQASNGSLALATLRTLRGRNELAQTSPQVDMAEASADAAVSDFRGELAACIRAQSRAAAQGSDLMEANALMGQANADDKLDNWDEALRLWRLAGKKYESIGDRQGMADALNHQAVLAFNKDDAPTATRLLNEAMSLSKAVGDRAGIAYSLTVLGTVHLYVDPAKGGDYGQALKLFSQAQAIYQETQNVAEEGNILSLFGDAAGGRMHLEEAKAYYLKAMALSEAANDRSRVANRLLDLGLVASWQGNLAESEQYFIKSIQAYEALGQQDRVAIVRGCVGGTLFHEGRIDQAALVLNQSLASMIAVGRRMQIYEMRFDLIRLEMIRNPAKAEALARENIELSKSVGRVGTSGDPTAFAALAEAEARQGKLKEAKEAIQQAFAPSKVNLSEPFVAEMLLERSYVDVRSRDFSAATVDLRRARQLTHAHGMVYLDLETRLAEAELHYLQFGNSAGPELDRVRQDAQRMGYGIIPPKVEAFLHSNMAS